MRNIELKFFLKILRNAVVLAGLGFISMWMTTPLITMEAVEIWFKCKPFAMFLILYVFTELAKRYNLDYRNEDLKLKSNTLIF